MADLYADENFSHRVVNVLRSLGHDVLTARDAGQDNQKIPDDEVLAYGTRHGRAVRTFNRHDFHRLHRQAPAHAGIIACTNDDDTPALAARIDAAVRLHVPLAGKLVRVIRPG